MPPDVEFRCLGKLHRATGEGGEGGFATSESAALGGLKSPGNCGNCGTGGTMAATGPGVGPPAARPLDATHVCAPQLPGDRVNTALAVCA